MRQIEQKVRDLVHDASTLTLAETISAHAAQMPEQAAILAPDRRALTYKQLHMQIQSVVRQLNSTGVGRSDRVAIVLPNGPELAVTVLAVSAAAISAPLNPSYRAAEFDLFLSDIGAKALVVLEGMDSPARTVAQAHDIPVVELSPDLKREAGLFTFSSASTPIAGCAELARPDDVALVLHTSGTTSRAKLVNLTHANLWTSARNIRMTLALARHDRCST